MDYDGVWIPWIKIPLGERRPMVWNLRENMRGRLNYKIKSIPCLGKFPKPLKKLFLGNKGVECVMFKKEDK